MSYIELNSNLFYTSKNLLISGLIFLVVNTYSQTEETARNWDNQIYIGNKVAIGNNNWRYSGELQVRLKDNTQNLDYYFLEGVATYLISKNWEITPDLRMSIKQDEFEIRPGLGVVNKVLGSKWQIVNQFKWQIDLDTKGNADNGMRYVIFLNYIASKKLIPNFVVGGFYRWQNDFQGIQFVRFGPGLGYVIDAQHVLNFNYLFSASNTRENWNWAGIPFLQLVININKDYKYVPAKYYNF